MTRELRVLLSEDREDDALLVVDELRQSGCTPLWRRVETPDEMRAALDEQDWDLIIADYDLPRFSAMGALEILRETGRDIPFLIVSGAVREIDAVAGMRAGVHDYLLKDNLTRLGAVVERELREAAMRRERRAAEAELRRQAQVLDQVHDAVIQTDLRGRIRKWNRGAERALGYTASDMVGQPLSVLFFEEGAPAAERIVEAVKLDGRYETELLNRHRSGEQRWLHVSLSLLYDENDAPYGIVGYAQDVTERKLAQEALRRADKLAGAGRMAATVAHEINNPLEAVTNLLYLVRGGCSPEVMPYLELAEHELARVAHITKQTLAFYRDTTVPRSFELGEVVRALLPFYQRRSETKGVEIRLDLRPGAVVHAAEGALTQVVSNLLSNALDASRPGCVLHVRTRGVGECARLTVADTGHGIPQEHRSKIWEPFFTTKEHIGTGLGLWISKEIVTKHAGRIRLRTSVRQGRSGTVFVLELPTARQTSAAGTAQG